MYRYGGHKGGYGIASGESLTEPPLAAPEPRFELDGATSGVPQGTGVELAAQ